MRALVPFGSYMLFEQEANVRAEVIWEIACQQGAMPPHAHADVVLY